RLGRRVTSGASAPDLTRRHMFLVTARACGPIGRCPHPDRRNDTLMVFKRMLAAFGVGGPSVDTVLDASHAMPGQVITGQVRIQGGGADADIDRIELSLVTRADAQSRGGQARGAAEFLRLRVAERLRVPANQLREVPFQLVLPWGTPITSVGSTALPGVAIGLRTELVVAGAQDKGDLDPVDVHPLPSQDA